jgi:serine/threonine protein kinase
VLAPGVVFGRFRVDAAFERAAPGATQAWLARDLEQGHEVVLEVLRSDATPREKSRFVGRARALVGVRHPSIVPLLETSEVISGSTRTPFATFAAVRGELLAENVGVAPGRARLKLAWIAQLAFALEALHAAGLVHGHVVLDEVIVQPDNTAKLHVPLGRDVSVAHFEDVRDLATLAVVLFLGRDVPGEPTASLTERFGRAGVPGDAAAVLARMRSGSPTPSRDAAQALQPFANYRGPTTEPLMPPIDPSRPPSR